MSDLTRLMDTVFDMANATPAPPDKAEIGPLVRVFAVNLTYMWADAGLVSTPEALDEVIPSVKRYVEAAYSRALWSDDQKVLDDAYGVLADSEIALAETFEAVTAGLLPGELN